MDDETKTLLVTLADRIEAIYQAVCVKPSSGNRGPDDVAGLANVTAKFDPRAWMAMGKPSHKGKKFGDCPVLFISMYADAVSDMASNDRDADSRTKSLRFVDKLRQFAEHQNAISGGAQ